MSVRFTDVGEFFLRRVEFLQCLLHRIGGPGGKMADIR